MLREMIIIMKADFSSGTIKTRGQESNIFRILKEKKVNLNFTSGENIF